MADNTQIEQTKQNIAQSVVNTAESVRNAQSNPTVTEAAVPETAPVSEHWYTKLMFWRHKKAKDRPEIPKLPSPAPPPAPVAPVPASAPAPAAAAASLIPPPTQELLDLQHELIEQQKAIVAGERQLVAQTEALTNSVRMTAGRLAEAEQMVTQTAAQATGQIQAAANQFQSSMTTAAGAPAGAAPASGAPAAATAAGGAGGAATAALATVSGLIGAASSAVPAAANPLVSLVGSAITSAAHPLESAIATGTALEHPTHPPSAVATPAVKTSCHPPHDTISAVTAADIEFARRADCTAAAATCNMACETCSRPTSCAAIASANCANAAVAQAIDAAAKAVHDATVHCAACPASCAFDVCRINKVPGVCGGCGGGSTTVIGTSGGRTQQNMVDIALHHPECRMCGELVLQAAAVDSAACAGVPSMEVHPKM